MERIRELKEKRDEIARTLAKLTVPSSVPPYLYKAETIRKFQTASRETLLSESSSIARAYLNRLVEAILVSEEEIVVELKAAATVLRWRRRGRRASRAPEPIRRKFSPTV